MVVITGAAGFIGSNLTYRFINAGVPVVAIDNLSTGTTANLKPVMGNPLFSFKYGDILDEEVLKKSFPQGAMAVIHLAARGSVPKSMENPAETYLINVVGTQRVVSESMKSGAKIFINASSSSVYGGAGDKGYLDEHGPLSPRSPYAHSKMVAEQIVDGARFFFNSEMETTNLRFFNVYGPNQKSWENGPVIPAMMDSFLLGTPFKMHGGGDQSRDFTFVEDVCDLIFEIVARRKVVSVMNVCCGESVGLGEAMRQIKAVLVDEGLVTPEYWPCIEYEELRAGDVKRSIGSTDIRKETYLTQFGYFKNGIRRWWGRK